MWLGHHPPHLFSASNSLRPGPLIHHPPMDEGCDRPAKTGRAKILDVATDEPRAVPSA